MIEITFRVKRGADPKKVATVISLVQELEQDGHSTLSAEPELCETEVSPSEPLNSEPAEMVKTEESAVAESAKEKPKGRKRRTKAEIEADAKAEELQKQQELNAAIAEENEAENSVADEMFGGLFDIEEDGKEEPEEADQLDTEDPNHMTILANLVSELREADDKNTKKIQDIMTKKLKAKTVKDLTTEQKQVFYSELLKLQ